MSRQRPDKRVVITGIGLVTPHGDNREASWLGLRSGTSATTWIEPSPGKADRPPGMSAGGRAPDCFEKSFSDEPVIAMAVRCAEEAFVDAELQNTAMPRERIGCVIGTSKGGVHSFAQQFRELRNPTSASAGVSPASFLEILPNAAAASVASAFDIRGPVLCPVTACATGLTCLIRGASLIRDGVCDVVLAGSSDASLQDAILASFQRMGVLARGFDDPACACRPFDRHRSGFVVGEGAAVLVMENFQHAAERNASIYAEWLADGMAADHSGLTSLEDEPLGLSRLIRDVLRRAELASDEIEYANLHGTATIQNDVSETRAISHAMGRASQRLRCSSLKGGIGHLLGAAGSVEMAATLLAMRDGVIPPTVNLTEADDDCTLDYTPQVSCSARVDHALKISLGFGGHLVAAIVRRVE